MGKRRNVAEIGVGKKMYQGWEEGSIGSSDASDILFPYCSVVQTVGWDALGES